MNILMLTNSFTPFVGGLERSIVLFAGQLRSRGHRVWVVAPITPGAPKHEENVVRVPAIQHFNGTDFSMKLPVPRELYATLKDFHPDIVHSHHPYLMGDTAVRIATAKHSPLVFTFHTFFEYYTHYTPLDSPRFKRFVAALATGYSNLCDTVVAPSNSVREELERRGVIRKISVVPTGIEVKKFEHGHGSLFRSKNNIPPDAFVIGIVCRMAPEKNLVFLSRVLARVMTLYRKVHFLMIGEGPSAEEIKRFFHDEGFGSRLHALGTLQGHRLIDGYHAMNVFVFASISETQGLVLTEAMASGVPVVAVDGPGVRDIIEEHDGGRLIRNQDLEGFVQALHEYITLPADKYRRRCAAARAGAADFSIARCTDLLLDVYQSVLSKDRFQRELRQNPWDDAQKRLRAEWRLLYNVAQATGTAFALKK